MLSLCADPAVELPKATPEYRDAQACRNTLIDVSDLGDLTEIHDRNAVGDVSHNRQIVSDKKVGEPQIGLKLFQQIDHAGTDRHVERGNRFVQDKEFRPKRQRPGNADALALAA